MYEISVLLKWIINSCMKYQKFKLKINNPLISYIKFSILSKLYEDKNIQILTGGIQDIYGGKCIENITKSDMQS